MTESQTSSRSIGPQPRVPAENAPGPTAVDPITVYASPNDIVGDPNDRFYFQAWFGDQGYKFNNYDGNGIDGGGQGLVGAHSIMMTKSANISNADAISVYQAYQRLVGAVQIIDSKMAQVTTQRSLATRTRMAILRQSPARS